MDITLKIKKLIKEYNTAYVEVNGQNVITNKPETEVQLSTKKKMNQD